MNKNCIKAIRERIYNQTDRMYDNYKMAQNKSLSSNLRRTHNMDRKRCNLRPRGSVAELMYLLTVRGNFHKKIGRKLPVVVIGGGRHYKKHGVEWIKPPGDK